MSFNTLGSIGIAGPAIWIIFVLALHAIQPDLDPIDDYISEYALGDFGWLMQTAFITVGGGTLAIAYGLRKSLELGKRVRPSIVLMVVTGLGFIMDGAFNPDPLGAEELTLIGNLHLLGTLLVIFSLVMAPFFLRGVFARNSQWQSLSQVALGFGVVLLVTFVITMATPEEGPVGLTQRIFVVQMMAWLVTLGWHIRNLEKIVVEPSNETAASG